MIIKDSAYYARARYTKASFDSAIKKMEFVNRVFRNNPDYNHLNILTEISVIHTPVLILQGTEDHAVGPKQGIMIYKALTGIPEDRKELHIIPDAAHNLNMEATEQYFTIVNSFFDKYKNRFW